MNPCNCAGERPLHTLIVEARRDWEGGTTEAALEVLHRALPALLQQAVNAAAERSKALANSA